MGNKFQTYGNLFLGSSESYIQDGGGSRIKERERDRWGKLVFSLEPIGHGALLDWLIDRSPLQDGGGLLFIGSTGAILKICPDKMNEGRA